MFAYRALVLAAVVASGTFAFSAPSAVAADSPAIGGQSGSEFRAECPSGEILNGLEFRTSSGIDAVAPICARDHGKDRLTKGTAQPFVGASTGRVRRFDCASDKAVDLLKISGASSVRAVQITCRSLSSAASIQLKCISPSGYCRDMRPTECAKGEVATGIHGRAGKTIHALGLICAPRPSSAPKAGPVADRAPEGPAAAKPPPPEEPAPAPPADMAPAEPPREAAPAEDVPEVAAPEVAPPEVTQGAPGPEAPPGAGAATESAEDAEDTGEAMPTPDLFRVEPPPPAAAPPPPPPPPAAAEAPRPREAAPRPAMRKMVAEPPKATAPDSDGKWRLVPVFYGTDRNAVEGGKRLTYGYERAKRLEVGRALVSVPTAHQVPNVERPWALTIPGTSIKLYEEEEDPAKHFTMREIKSMSQADLLKLVKERLKSSKSYKDQALIFVHGYNTDFDNAIYRTAQIAHDLEFDGAPFLYSWPSRGDLTGYFYDGVSNEQAEPYMREFVELVAKKSGAKQVSIIAHSMGNRVTLRVLKELKAAKVSINQIILAAPDVDRASFESITRELKGLSKGITLYAAGNDKALMASRAFNGEGARAGDVPASGPVLVPGVDTIDVTTLSTDSLGLNHSTYAERTDLIDDIAKILKSGVRPPIKRTPKLTRIPSGTLEYWKYP